MAPALQGAKKPRGKQPCLLLDRLAWSGEQRQQDNRTEWDEKTWDPRSCGNPPERVRLGCSESLQGLGGHPLPPPSGMNAVNAQEKAPRGKWRKWETNQIWWL